MIRLRELRKEKGITMKQLGKIVGVGESTISQYENGKRQPDYNTLISLANILSVSVDYLIGADSFLSGNEISVARARCANLSNVYDVIISEFEHAVETSYATFRTWILGFGDYFNNIVALSRIATYFNVSVDYLLGRTNIPQPDGELMPIEQELLDKFRLLDDTGKEKAGEYLADLAKIYNLELNVIDDANSAIVRPGTIIGEADIHEIENIVKTEEGK